MTAREVLNIEFDGSILKITDMVKIDYFFRYLSGGYDPPPVNGHLGDGSQKVNRPFNGWVLFLQQYVLADEVI